MAEVCVDEMSRRWRHLLREEGDPQEPLELFGCWFSMNVNC